MATRRRDSTPMQGKEKTAIPSPSSFHSTKTTPSANPSRPKLRLATQAPATDVSKQLGKKPSSTHSPPLDRTKPLQRKTPSISQIQKSTIAKQKTTRASTNPPLQPSSSPGKIVASQKPVQAKEKNVKAKVMDTGKHRPMHARPVDTGRKVGADIKKQGIKSTTSAINSKKHVTQNATSAIKGRINRFNSTPVLKKVRHMDAPVVKCPDEEMFLTEADDMIEEYLQSNGGEKGFDNLVLVENNKKDAEIVTADSSVVLEHQDAPTGIETEVAENKPCIDEARNEEHESEEHTVNEVNNSNTVESVANNTNGAEDEMVEEAAEAFNNKEEAAASGREVHVFQNTEGREEVEEKKQDPDNGAPKEVPVDEKKPASENAAPKVTVEETNPESDNAPSKQVVKEKKREPGNAAPRLQVKKAISPVSNDTIEETATKLREQRKDRVKALARAFEHVIALQEK